MGIGSTRPRGRSKIDCVPERYGLLVNTSEAGARCSAFDKGIHRHRKFRLSASVVNGLIFSGVL